MSASRPESFRRIVGELPAAGELPDGDASPFDTVRPIRDGYVERDGVKSWYAVWGESGPWIAFAPIFQIVHSQMLKATVPYLSQHFRVVTMDGRGNGRSDRPDARRRLQLRRLLRRLRRRARCRRRRQGRCGWHLGRRDDRAATGGRTARPGHARGHRRRICAMPPGRRCGSRAGPRPTASACATTGRSISTDFFTTLFHRAAFDQTVRRRRPLWLGEQRTDCFDWCRDGWNDSDVRELAQRCAARRSSSTATTTVACSHTDGEAIHDLVPDSRLLTIGGGGHLTAVRDPVVFNRALRDFVVAQAAQLDLGARDEPPAQGAVHLEPDRPRAMCSATSRSRASCASCSPTSRSTGSPSIRRRATWNARASACIRSPRRLANESRHFEHVAGEHDLRRSSRCARWTRSWSTTS